MDLPEFLAECLDSQEADARRLMRVAQDVQIELSDHKKWLGREMPGWEAWADIEKQCTGVLADVAAKRAILDRFQQREELSDTTANPRTRERATVEGAALWMAVQLLAEPYRDRPGFKSGWLLGTVGPAS